MSLLAIVQGKCAGRRKSAKKLRQILEQLQQWAPSIERIEADESSPGFSKRVAEAETLIVIGGDGTLHKTFPAMDLRRQKAALIPMGRGNSLARDLGLRNTARALQAIRQARFAPIDLMQLTAWGSNGKRTILESASSIAVGYPAAVTCRAGSRFRRFGRSSYLLAAAAIRHPAFSLELRYGDQVPRSVELTGWVANNTRHMASFLAFPEADCRDGRFDVMELSAGYFPQLLHALSALNHRSVYRPCTPMQMSQAEVCLRQPQELMVDGEIIEGILKFQIRILPLVFCCCHNGNPPP